MSARGEEPAPSNISWQHSVWRGTAPLRGMIFAGALAGFVAAGIGSRVVMRIIAVINDDRDGVLTDASATVGEISLGGTMSLLVLGTIAGVLGGLVYLGLRRWLWVPRPWRGVAFGALTLFTVGHPLLDPANVDFQIFEPILVVIALFAALFFVNGLILTALADRIHPEPAYAASIRVPRVAAGVIGIVWVLGVILMVDTVRTMVEDSGTCYSASGGGQGCAVLDIDASP